MKNVKYPNKKEGWDLEGIIHGRTNKSYKFDTRPIEKFNNNSEGKIGYFNTKAEKMVFEFKDKWIILDIQELNEYIKKNNIKDISLNYLIDKLNWSIIIDKK